MTNNTLKIAILIPTLNAGKVWTTILESISLQSVKVDRKIIIDSGSLDETVPLAEKNGFQVLTIDKVDFDHGYARQLLAEAASDCDILIYLTQDCILKDSTSFAYLVNAFKDEKVGLAYGRQLPHIGAKTLETHARLFNYTDVSRVKTIEDKNELGIKTASCSNSYAAYRKTALQDVGGFPSHTIFAEDVIVGGQLLIKDWKIAYVAESQVYHSHDYTTKEEFKRYFDIGVFHSTNKWLLEEFGTAGGEGLKYLKSELKYVLKNNPLVLPKMMLSIGAKFLGYKLGMMHKKLSPKQRKDFSMHKRYWDKVK
ncbi:rhamnosyltransferase [Pedobacter psychrotolerans]|uniref:Rhamnosyltransferase n=1 Tax=Pedobacter psychrotolerans TaxID=1843235 RepID=A0A4V2RZL0_9SPHI|nr:glycosyltransferase [Pedobacter psychrotolerans]TCO26678.1 rhamnosyltransferase [Pedobacter psychrotolerans]GGE55663.1 rhamnosyltransferase [Pedobacter psychrotolerans]